MALLLKNCDILATENGSFRHIKNGFLGISAGIIDYIGSDRPEKAYDSEKDLSGKLLIPGLVNAHTHTPMSLLRGVGSGLPLDKWLFDCVFPIEDRMTADDIEIGSRLALLEMLACGTTSFTDMYMWPERTVNAVVESGMKANICRPVQSFDENELPEDNFRIKESLQLFEDFNNAADGRVLIDFCVHAEYTCNSRTVGAYSELVKERGGNLHIHLSETRKEHEECIARHGKTPAEWFSSLGAFDSGAFAAHCVAVSDGDIDILKEKGVGVVHCPTSNMKLGSGFSPIRKMLDKGITVALGTDGQASNNNLNMFEEMHLASVIHCGYHHDSTLITPDVILKMATENGAKIQRRYDTGSLEVGKCADITAVSQDAPHLIPMTDPVSNLVYSAQGSDVYMTMVNGRILYENGEYKTLDKEKIMAEAKAAAARLRC